jgi:YfiH family protein
MQINEAFMPSTSYKEMLFLQRWMSQYPWLTVGFSTRLGGRSQPPYESLNCGLHVGDRPIDVVQNRNRLVQLQGYSFEQWTCANQIHGSSLYQVGMEDRGKGNATLDAAIPDVDGLYTRRKDIFLASFYADCVPIYFLDPINRVVGIAHAGWKGTVSNIATKMIKRWQEEFGTDLSTIRVAIGPAIGGCCYEVDDTVMDHIMPHADYLSTKAYTSNENGRYQLDLKQVNYDFIKKAGILSENIEVSSWCTSCRSDLFFSHRKENGKTGRMTAFIAIKEEEIVS